MDLIFEIFHWSIPLDPLFMAKWEGGRKRRGELGNPVALLDASPPLLPQLLPQLRWSRRKEGERRSIPELPTKHNLLSSLVSWLFFFFRTQPVYVQSCRSDWIGRCLSSSNMHRCSERENSADRFFLHARSLSLSFWRCKIFEWMIFCETQNQQNLCIKCGFAGVGGGSTGWQKGDFSLVHETDFGKWMYLSSLRFRHFLGKMPFFLRQACI